MADVIKSKKLTSADLELINKFTLKPLTEDEIFNFSVVLCTNEIDRDCESFTKNSIEKLAKMFVGKTGIFDHETNANNQTARIYRTEIETPNELTSFGENKVVLKANAYMVKSCEFNGIIKKINAGILKEISISCKIEKKLCSICGKSFDGCCGHELKKIYGSKMCFIELVNPIDAYEWSFVTVPAQINAHTVKHFNKNVGLIDNEILNNAQIGKQQILNLRQHVMKLGFLCGFCEPNNSNFANVIKKLNFDELNSAKLKFEKLLLNKNLKESIVNYKPSLNENLNNIFQI